MASFDCIPNCNRTSNPARGSYLDTGAPDASE